MISLKKMSMRQKAFSVLAFHPRKCVCMEEKDICACMDTFTMSAYINIPKSWQAFSCFSRVSIWVQHPKNYVLPVFIARWPMLSKDKSVNTSMLNVLNSSEWHEFSYPNWYKLFWWMLKHSTVWGRFSSFFCLKKEALTSQG